MKSSTAIFLVCLRLAIGWHFLVEGWHKVDSQLVGNTATSRAFSSSRYFQEAPGPFARLMRSKLGDPDDELLARLSIQPMPQGVDPAAYPAQNRVPPALAIDWDSYLARFINYYDLSDQQKKMAEAKLQQEKHNFAVWLLLGEKKVKKSYSGVELERSETTQQRIAEYRGLVEEIRDAYDRKLPLFGRDVEKANLAMRKAEAAKLRDALAGDLNDKTLELRKVLDDVLTPAQKDRAKSDDKAKEQKAILDALPTSPQREHAQKLRGDVAEDIGNTALHYLDRATAWGLFGIGVSLLLGLFSRLGCILGAGFLLLTYLAAPPMPWWPTPPQQEGTYLFVNKNVVEMLALLVLATTASGRWLGLDGLIHWVFSGLMRRKEAA